MSTPHESPSAPAGGVATIKQVPWLRVCAFWLVCLVVGVAMALLIKSLGWWDKGGGWEVDLMRWIGAHSSENLKPIMLWISTVGTFWTMAPFVAIAGGFMWWRGARFSAVMLTTALVGGWVLHPLLKFSLYRPRPEVLPQVNFYMMPAYPSGHAIAMFGVLLSISWLVKRHGYGWWGFPVAIFLAALNGYSRMYNGVHWPTDILCGAVLGLMWFFFLTRIFCRLISPYGNL